jgi:hypothetical protein
MASFANLGLSVGRGVRSARTQRDATLAQNAYSRFLSQQRGDRELRSLGEQTNRDLGALSAAYSQRGLRNSGLQQQARNEFGTQAFRSEQDIRNQTAQQLDMANLSDAQAQAAYESAVQEAEIAKANSIAQLAAELLNYYPFMGS